jgi:NAD(P)-dependent dehydrogenase (short-subunit alcohol dehydrogenase family)
MHKLKTEHLHLLDVTSPPSIEAFANGFGLQPLDLLLNVAGKLNSYNINKSQTLTSQGIMPPKEADSLTTVSMDSLTKTFNVNTFGPLLLTQSVLKNLLLSESPKIANVSSRVGSMADNSSGGAYAYRASKAALNALSKSMAVDLKEKGVTVVILHPGIVKTGLDPTSHTLKEAVEPEEAVEGLWSVLKSKGLEDTGRFWHRNGTELEW